MLLRNKNKWRQQQQLEVRTKVVSNVEEEEPSTKIMCLCFCCCSVGKIMWTVRVDSYSAWIQSVNLCQSLYSVCVLPNPRTVQVTGSRRNDKVLPVLLENSQEWMSRNLEDEKAKQVNPLQLRCFSVSAWSFSCFISVFTLFSSLDFSSGTRTSWDQKQMMSSVDQ